MQIDSIVDANPRRLRHPKFQPPPRRHLAHIGIAHMREARESSADGKGRLNPQDLPQETGLTGRAASVPAARLIYARRDPPSLGLRFKS